MTPSAETNSVVINQSPQNPLGQLIGTPIQVNQPTSVQPTIDIAASQNPSHPTFHINFGKVLASIMFGLQVYGAESASPNATQFLTNPTNLSNIVSGFSSIWVTK